MKKTERKTAVSGMIIMLVLTVFLIGQAAAGNLEPASAPAPTMRTLEEVTSWNRVMPAAQRFVNALNGNAVLDKETGLVWEKKPSDALIHFDSICDHCFNLRLDGRMGWRLPSMNEFTSLFDTSPSGKNTLPVGHPFSGVVPGGPYWTSSKPVGYTTERLYVIQLDDNGALSKYENGLHAYGWCVRSR